MTIAMSQPAPGAGVTRVKPDDEIYRSSRAYLGPPGYTLPVRIPYRAMPVVAAVFFPGLIALRIVGLSGIALYVVTLAVSCGVAALVVRVTGPERPVSALATIVSHEISAPRQRRKPQEPVAVTLRPDLIPVGPLPAPRRPWRIARRREGEA